MSRIITFLSDFGERDWFVAAVKGEILKINNHSRIIDITHQVDSYDVKSAAFLVMSYFKNFPEGTVHLVVVDPGVGGDRLPVIVESHKYYFVGPDNGVFSYIYDNDSKVYEIRADGILSATFHGRDIFGPTAAKLSKGVSPDKLGRRIEKYIKFEFPELRFSGKEIFGEIMYIDKFGNLITNIPVNLRVEKFIFDRREIGIRESYGEAESNEVFGIKGSGGFYEISANQDSAKKILSARIGMDIYARLRDR